VLCFICFLLCSFQNVLLKRVQVFDKIALLLFGQAQPLEGIVVLDHISRSLPRFSLVDPLWLSPAFRSRFVTPVLSGFVDRAPAGTTQGGPNHGDSAITIVFLSWKISTRCQALQVEAQSEKSTETISSSSSRTIEKQSVKTKNPGSANLPKVLHAGQRSWSGAPLNRAGRDPNTICRPRAALLRSR
jgi:hypothetical protein